MTGVRPVWMPRIRALSDFHEKGAEAEIVFDGTGAILTGPYLPNGGKADVYLDGKLQKTVDVNSDEEQGKSSESV